ncbi:MAG: methyl-accepting chemotaxis protein, partial [Oscillospiraceae bacterium]
MLKNMKIGKRLMLSFILVAVIASIAGCVGLGILLNMNASYSKALVENGFVQGDLGTYTTHLSRGGAIVRDVILLTDPEQIKASQAELEEAKTLTAAAEAKARVNCKTPAELKLFARIDENAPKYKEARDRAVALGLQNKNDEAWRIFRDEARPYLNQLLSAGEELAALNVEMGNQVKFNLNRSSTFAAILIFALIVSALLISIVLAIFISKGIANPIKLCADRLVLLSSGDLKSDVPEIKSKDESGMLATATKTIVEALRTIIMDEDYLLGEMANGNFDIRSRASEVYIGDFTALLSSMRKINTSLSHTISQINASSDQVSSGAEQVSSGAQALSQGSTEQASSVEELAATITEIASKINDNAVSAREASQKTNEAGREVNVSNKKM